MTGTMNALVKAQREEGIWLQQQPVPAPGPDEVLIRVHRTAICGTDIHIYNWDEWAQRTIPVPMIVGHEFGGEIAEIGSNVSRPLKIGQNLRLTIWATSQQTTTENNPEARFSLELASDAA